MNRNVTILVIVLVIILIFGYLIWLRNRFQTVTTQVGAAPTQAVTPTSIPTIIASPSAVASPSVTVKPSGTKISPSPTKSPRVSTPSGKTVR